MNMRVEVYFNLHKRCFSVRHAGRVIFHSNLVRIRHAQFVVQPAGRARVLAEGKKNVHAFVRGTLIAEPNAYHGVLTRATYNPYKYSTFIDVDTKKPLYLSSYVTLLNNNKPEIYYETSSFNKSHSTSFAA